jgi:hypothetical protein
MIRFATERVFLPSHYSTKSALPSSGLDIILLLPRAAPSAAHLPPRDLRLNREERLSII